MDNDDLPVGRILNRREVLALLGAAGAGLLLGCSTGDSEPEPTSTTQSGTSDPTATATSAAASAATTTASSGAGDTATSAATEAATDAATATATTEATQAVATSSVATLPACVVSPELTEGPYFVDELLDRSDIRSDPSDGSLRDGTTLQLVLHVSQVSNGNCAWLAGATVDVWHCDALGVYSDVSDPGFDTSGQKFLRGYQVTDANGTVQFTTIYPGWYEGRAVHIHFKIRGDATTGGSYEFTSQFFFDESVTDIVHAEEPYAGKGYRTLLNEGDSIYQQSEGMLTLVPTATDDGYTATFEIGVQLD